MQTPHLAVTASILLALGVGGIGAASPAFAEPVSTDVAPDSAPQSAFTARVASVQHSTGVITVAGTGRPGETVWVSGPTLEAGASARVAVDGSFQIAVRTTRPGTHVLTVTPSVPGPSIELEAETRMLLPSLWAGVPDDWNRAIDFGSRSGWYPYSTVVVNVDGIDLAQTTTDRDGRWDLRVEDIPFGSHIVVVRSVFDGAVQFSSRDVFVLDGSAVVAASSADLATGRLSASGTAPSGTSLFFTDVNGTPIPTADGANSVDVVDGTWSAQFPLPGQDVNLYEIVVHTLDDGREVGQVTAPFSIPNRLSASVQLYKPKKLVVAGHGEPGAIVSFTDAAGAPVTDADGGAAIVEVGRDGSWKRTLDPRRFTGGTVTATAADGATFLGAATVTFR